MLSIVNMDDLSVLPPDRDVFHEKKPCSTKQKEHLSRARESAKKTIERRRALEIAEKARADTSKAVVPEPERPSSPGQDPDVASEDEPEPPLIAKSKSVRKGGRKTVELTEEEADERRFAKFMKNMSAYERLKVQHAEEAEEAKKVKVSLTQAEYEHMVNLLDSDKKKREMELEKTNPVEPSKTAPTRPRISSMRGNVNAYNERFG